MKKAGLKFLALSCTGYFLLCAFLYFYQDNLLYFPKDREVANPENTYLLKTDVGNTVVTTEVRNQRKALIYFGGNAEDVSKRLEDFKQTFPNHSLYLLHYRGYGGSDGNPREESIYQDAQALYERVQKDHTEIVLMGRSLGTGIATRLAAEKAIENLILVTPYTSIEDLASERYWGVPVSLLLKDKYLSWQYAQLVKADTAVFLAEQDQVIAPANTLKLLEYFKPGVATLYRFEDKDHRTVATNPKYFELLKELTQAKDLEASR
ncbi:alpha/beta hydrolase [Neptuniibacter caesariensis]|uniref:Serine aminopeptidase S33 domain-containing protein n=1 Tax=Neptuniibacter caesariensis TaxID=207954 RepID=A0A7U8GTM3_NEPCE|nr:alpha/beta hydrolase [Neptuniibacter caesariensis]EAR62290.1 hypothetical protein MED92_14673 [Oceanospirillum sp. MED92] [Neptuniibacter caesariensis]